MELSQTYWVRESEVKDLTEYAG